MNSIINTLNLSFNENLIPLTDVKNIIIHHTHNPNLTTMSTHEMHINRFKWAGIGYNYFIEKDGSIYEGRGMYVGAHAKLHNKNSIGIALAGNFDENIPNERQMQSLIDLTVDFMKRFDIEVNKVLGHRELDGVTKTCPGKLFDMDLFRKDLLKNITRV